MARGDWNGGSDRDTDARPGSSSSSRSYDKIFDVRGESELSNRPETSIQILRTVREQEAAVAAANSRLSAQSRVHMFQGVGKFVIPPEQYKDTWSAHAELIKDHNQNLYFNPEKFPYFDAIIAEKLNLPALTDPKHRDYAKYEGLRTNLAVLRNDIIGIYVDDGSFDPSDVVHIPKIAAIAEAIGTGLKNDTWFRRPFVPSISMDVANVEAIGAREIYKQLIEQQTKSAGPLEGLRSRFKHLLGMPELTWNLPPIENTPFSDQGLSAPPPPQRISYTAEELAAACAKDNNRLVELSEDTARIALDVSSLETLKAPKRDTSTEEARRLFRFLRNLQQGDENVETWMGSGTPTEQVAKAQALHRLIEIYSGELHKATRARPEAFYNVIVDEASETAGGFAFGLAVHTANSLPPLSPEVVRLDTMIDAMPEVWDQRSQQSVKRLLDTLEAGLRHTMGADVSDKSAADRLVEFSAHIRDTAQKLRRAEDMDRPAREESIELAREILRRLKNIKFNDRPIEELTRGDVEHKAEFAQKVDEMVDTYQTLLAEAAQNNPDILKDQRVLAANEAVGQFAHAISLMAAKEMHTDMAASQKISAEIAVMPEEWKDLDGKTVGKLAERMEGGLEQAVGELAAEQQEQQKREEETVQDVADSHHQHSRRKRRRRSASSGLGAGGMRKVDRDIRADDIALNQGRFQESPGARATDRQPLLRPEDRAAVQAVSSNLRTINSIDMTNLAAVDIKPGDKIAPDDKGAVAFVDQMREQRNNRNTQGGGNRNNPNNQRPTRT
jgi:hypothetical protein